MSIRELRILPPLAFGRLGSAPEPLDNFTIVENDDHPLDYRRIVPQETLRVDPRTGAIAGSHTPATSRSRTASAFDRWRRSWKCSPVSIDRRRGSR